MFLDSPTFNEHQRSRIRASQKKKTVTTDVPDGFIKQNIYYNPDLSCSLSAAVNTIPGCINSPLRNVGAE